MINNGEFKGSTKQALADLKEHIQEIKNELASLNRRYWVVLILLVVTVIERLPTLINLALAQK